MAREYNNSETGLRELWEDGTEAGLIEAIRWRKRIKDGASSISDAKRDVIFGHFDAVVKAAHVYRSKLVSLREGKGK
jgi:hypothetical protein